MGQVAPWTDEQVENIRAWQGSTFLHGFTCPRHSERQLTPTRLGLVCDAAGCAYRQEWVPTLMTRPPDGVARCGCRKCLG